MSRAKLRNTALLSLLALALLIGAVWHNTGSYGFERLPIRVLVDDPFWDGHLADLLAVPVIGVVLVLSFVYAGLNRALLRVTVYAGFAAAAFVIGEEVLKPLVDMRYYGQFSFPSGNVTAVCATACAMWMALYPLMGRWTRVITFALGAAWTVLVAMAVIGARWHTPLDTVGSILLSIGVITTGAAFYEQRKTTPESPVRAQRARVGGGV